MNKTLVNTCKTLIKSGRYRLTLHAERERGADLLTIKQIEEVVLCDKMEIIEEYPDDPRGPSFLLLGFTDKGEVVHVVGAIHENTLIMITLYRPDPNKWKNYKERVR